MKPDKQNYNYMIIEIASYEGSDTYLHCGDHSQDYLYAVVAADDSGHARIVDTGYRSIQEAYESWPESIPTLDNQP